MYLRKSSTLSVTGSMIQAPGGSASDPAAARRPLASHLTQASRIVSAVIIETVAKWGGQLSEPV